MRYRTAAGTVVGAVVLAVLGALMGPQWAPVPLTDPLTVQTQSTAITDAPALGTYPVRSSVLTVQLDGADVEARLLMPVGVDGDVPAVVFVHGAGTGKFEDAFVDQARSLAEAGVATLVPNKRLDTYTLRHRDYVAMADDYLRSWDLLRGLPGVDPDRVGVYAESEGAWIAPVMAADQPDIGFVVLASAPVVPPRQQAAFAVDSYLRNTGVPQQVFRAIPRAVGMSLPGGGLDYADFDVAPYQRRMTQPVLVVYGTADASMPVVQGAEQIIRDLAIAGNTDCTVRYYRGADHGIRVDEVVAPAFLHDLAGWVQGLPDTASASPRIAGQQPEQLYWAGPVPQPRWLGDGDVLLFLVAGAVGVLVLLPVGRLAVVGVRRVRGREAGPGRDRTLTRRLALLSAASVATVVALVWYLVAVARLAVGYERNGWIVQGGWVAVRVLGLVAVYAAAAVVVRLRRLRRAGEPMAHGVLGHVVLWGTCAASAALLVVLAYWGVYQLGI
ncbi:alpha/beta hydrolase family protein [Cellulomonas sp.]|uniref:alpha/beta hydrolase family protein n=1 Tax=Cellulomonas sp. TaxID=40001 RepID=UPI002D34C76B|nr:prolyl oligopeptidase family serine peptidase [Cellulomonas sp.]HYQ75173.1 prolyl oligopeptidase family serine peptidase [Cellulomonas sp.]